MPFITEFPYGRKLRTREHQSASVVSASTDMLGQCVRVLEL
jgi:hypothetical protein